MKLRYMSMLKARGARKAQRNGKIFEESIKRICNNSGIGYIQQFVQTSQSRGKIFYVAKAAPDFMIFKDAQAIFFDAKSFDSDHVTYTQINQNQVMQLKRLNEHGFKAGYLVHLRAIGEVCFFPVHKLLSVQPRGSLRLIDAISLKGLDLGEASMFNIGLLFETKYSSVTYTESAK